jgi:spermidine synthase
LVLGMGAGGSIAATQTTAPEIETDAVELDPQVVEAGTRFFGLRPAPDRLRVHVADARPWLERSGGNYDLVHVDLYQGGPYVPFYLTTVEFFRLVQAHMSADGLLMMNVFDAGASRALLLALVATLESVFPSVKVFPSGSSNYMIIVFSRKQSADSIRARLRNVSGGESVKFLARRAAASLVDLVPPSGTLIFTDDYCPVEEMTRRMLTQEQ